MFVLFCLVFKDQRAHFTLVKKGPQSLNVCFLRLSLTIEGVKKFLQPLVYCFKNNTGIGNTCVISMNALFE
jgi:hypothetical protein